jgi:hypothetical protein
MRRELQIASALVALLAAPALAQNTPAAPAAGQEAAPVPGTQAAGEAAPATSAAEIRALPQAGSPKFVDRQQDDEMLAGTLIGTQVVNAADESLGEINDVLLAADGRLKAAVVGVGGFLGIAERDVAVPWDALAVSRDDDEDLLLRLDVSREQLEAAPDFETVADRRAAEEAARMAQTAGAPGAVTGAGGAVAPAPGTPPAPTQ